MHLFVTKKKRSKMLKESLENMVAWAKMYEEEDILDLDDVVYRSGDAAKLLLELWFDEKEEA